MKKLIINYTELVDYLLGKIEVIAELLGLEHKISFRAVRHPTLHPGRAAEVRIGDQSIGVFGEVHPKVADNYQLDIRVMLGELNLAVLLDQAKTGCQYRPLPRYPAVPRDLALIVKKTVPAGQILERIRKAGGKMLEDVSLFDIYEGNQIPEGYKSMAFSLVYRASDRTLKDDEVNQVHKKILNALEREIGAKLR